MEQFPHAGRRPGPGDAPVVIYDGACGLCHYGVRHLAARWRLPGRLLPWQAADLDSLGLNEDDVRARMWYLAPGRAPAGGSAAIAAWFADGGRGARVLARLLRAPGVRTAAEIGYRCVARNRHRIPGPWERSCTPWPGSAREAVTPPRSG